MQSFPVSANSHGNNSNDNTSFGGESYFKANSISSQSKAPTTSAHPNSTRPPSREKVTDLRRPSTDSRSASHAHSESTQSGSTTSRPLTTESRNTSSSSSTKHPSSGFIKRVRSSSIRQSSEKKAEKSSLSRQNLNKYATSPWASSSIANTTLISPVRQDTGKREHLKPPPAHQESSSSSGLGNPFVEAAIKDAASFLGKRDSTSSIEPFEKMLARPATSHPEVGGAYMASAPPQSPTVESVTYQHIQDTSSKRISTLDYLRKAHEGRVYWFNTLLFTKPDLQKMPYFESRKLARRATNYLLLGLSLPTVMDLNISTAVEFLRTLNALLAEFESFQSIHPPDGSSSLSRARFPQMFKRAATTATKGRRSSSANEIGLPSDYTSSENNSGSASIASFSANDSDLLPGEEYTHLLTPSLPFDPDFYETFATLCDVLISCYTKLMELIATPRECTALVAEMFTKADSRVRKIIVQGVVKEFEESSRGGVKNEVASVGRVVLGGLF